MGDLTRNISRWEVACKCGCGLDTIDFLTATVVQEVCDHIAHNTDQTSVVLHINSGCRCEVHNKREGGAEDSKHLTGRAIDFWIEGIDPALVYNYLTGRFPCVFGIGNYEDFTHLDTDERFWRKKQT